MSARGRPYAVFVTEASRFSANVVNGRLRTRRHVAAQVVVVFLDHEVDVGATLQRRSAVAVDHVPLHEHAAAACVLAAVEDDPAVLGRRRLDVRCGRSGCRRSRSASRARAGLRSCSARAGSGPALSAITFSAIRTPSVSVRRSRPARRRCRRRGCPRPPGALGYVSVPPVISLPTMRTSIPPTTETTLRRPPRSLESEIITRAAAFVRAPADVDGVDRSARDLHVLHRHLVREHGDSVQLDAVRTSIRSPEIVTRTGVGSSGRERLTWKTASAGIASPSLERSRTSPVEAADTSAVGDDPRVVAADPEAAGRVALAAGEPRQDDRAAAVQPRLQPGGVVASVAPGRRREGERSRRPCNDAESDAGRLDRGADLSQRVLGAPVHEEVANRLAADQADLPVEQPAELVGGMRCSRATSSSFWTAGRTSPRRRTATSGTATRRRPCRARRAARPRGAGARSGSDRRRATASQDALRLCPSRHAGLGSGRAERNGARRPWKTQPPTASTSAATTRMLR